ncbi:MAG TPA: NAD(P)-dependent oxidoreductase [Limnochordia bacterium]|nr:NAD(P)-dependent oxidoreductase [Limnochordia bacterium]
MRGIRPGARPIARDRARQGRKQVRRQSELGGARMSNERLGFVGLGTMGRPMCTNLLAAGFEVSVYARREEQMRPLQALGARPLASPKAVAEAADVIITIVGDSPDVEAVVTGENGLLAGARAGQAIIDMTSIAPEAARRLAAVAAQKGVAMLDAPVTGGDVGAKQGTLTIMVGGDKAVLERCRPILERLGKRIVWAGEAGMGQTLKLCNQILCGLHLVAMGEGLAFAQACGLDLETVLEVVTNGAAGSWALSNLGPRIARGDFAPGFSVGWQQKDLRNAQAHGQALQFPMPGTALAQQLLRFTEALGHTDSGTQAIIKAYEAMQAKR